MYNFDVLSYEYLEEIVPKIYYLKVCLTRTSVRGSSTALRTIETYSVLNRRLFFVSINYERSAHVFYAKSNLRMFIKIFYIIINSFCFISLSSCMRCILVSSIFLQLKQVIISDRAIYYTDASMGAARPIRFRECFCAAFGCVRLRELFATFTLCLCANTYARTFDRQVSPRHILRHNLKYVSTTNICFINCFITPIRQFLNFWVNSTSLEKNKNKHRNLCFEIAGSPCKERK